MTIATHAQLKTSIADWAARPELADTLLTDFVTLTEAMFNNGDQSIDFPPLRARQMEETATVTVSGGTGDLPSDFLEAIKVKDPGDTTRNIEFATPDWIDENFPTGQDGTYPSFYTIIGDQLICPISVSLTYYQSIPTLTTGASTTNWLLTAAPNAYLWGGLMQYSIYSKNAENVGYYRTLLVGALSGIQRSSIGSKAGRLTRRSGAVAW